MYIMTKIIIDKNELEVGVKKAFEDIYRDIDDGKELATEIVEEVMTVVAGKSVEIDKTTSSNDLQRIINELNRSTSDLEETGIMTANASRRENAKNEETVKRFETINHRFEKNIDKLEEIVTVLEDSQQRRW